MEGQGEKASYLVKSNISALHEQGREELQGNSEEKNKEVVVQAETVSGKGSLVLKLSDFDDKGKKKKLESKNLRPRRNLNYKGPFIVRTARPKVYYCNFCNYKFETPQAYGGHLNSHKYERDSAIKRAESKFRPMDYHPYYRLLPNHHGNTGWSSEPINPQLEVRHGSFSKSIVGRVWANDIAGILRRYSLTSPLEGSSTFAKDLVSYPPEDENEGETKIRRGRT
ncbi:hypothetical protein IFM89_014417 [Coptis chinensis]|uniref:C2H2-type domain-containing protein n=1 Tax=Coptis chinensis TaxID=261450 RepID=A0A835I4X6_9MAGN|nr:hypothetical protein IFM89_014417 [Coptis chinensis]